MDLSELCKALKGGDHDGALEVYSVCPPSPKEHGRALILAAFMGGLGLVDHILVHEDSEVDLNARHMDPAYPNSEVPVGIAALRKAIDQGHLDIVSALLEDGRIEFDIHGAADLLYRANSRGRDGSARLLLDCPPVYEKMVEMARADPKRLRIYTAHDGGHVSSLREFLDEFAPRAE